MKSSQDMEPERRAAFETLLAAERELTKHINLLAEARREETYQQNKEHEARKATEAALAAFMETFK